MLASLRHDAQTLSRLHDTYSSDQAYQEAASRAVELVLRSVHGGAGGGGGGSVFTTGIGKAGVVAKRLSISLASVSVPSQWVHGTEWVHGDLGSLREGDVVVAISHSGKTAELLDLAMLLPGRGVPLLAIVGNATSPVSRVVRWASQLRSSLLLWTCVVLCMCCSCACAPPPPPHHHHHHPPHLMHRSSSPDFWVPACVAQLAQAATSVLHAPAADELLECIPSRSLVAQEVRLLVCCLRTRTTVLVLLSGSRFHADGQQTKGST